MFREERDCEFALTTLVVSFRRGSGYPSPFSSLMWGRFLNLPL